ncbi:MAG TPA: hypothetical protein ENI15_16040 [Spirochaetes bacterium]|nr:hypothetical protein [Spirochaetota bacterium]
MKKLAVYIILALYCLAPVTAIDFGGIFEIDYYGLIDPTTFYESERIRLTLATEISGRSKSRWLDFHLSGLLYAQPIGEPAFVELERIVREAYLGLHFSIFDINIGQKFVNWGKVDILSPLNIINHSDTTVLSLDNILEGSLPDPMVQVQVYLADSFNLEIVYVPFLQPNIYPVEEILINEYLELDIPPLKKKIFDLDAAFINTEIKPFSELANSIHIAANYTSYLFDLIASYSWSVDQALDFDLSGIEEEITEFPDRDEHLIRGTAFPAYNRIHNIGAGVSFYLRNLLISADSALKITRDWDGSRMEIKNSELFSTIQVERMFLNRVRVQLNLFHKYVFNYSAQLQSTYGPFMRVYINAVIDDYLLQKPQSQVYILAHFDTHFFRERLLLGGNFIYGYTEKAYYIIPRIAYKLSDYLSISAGADIWIKGTAEGLLGRNETRDNFFIRMQLAW